jgi:hypothetical protein
MAAAIPLDPVHRFVVNCLSRADVGSGEADAQPSDSLDWDQVIGYAAEQGVAALLFRRLTASTGRCQAPFEVKRTFLKAYLANQVRNTQLYNELHRVVKALQGEGIPVVVLKGAHLAQLVFGDIGVRSMSDLDLLIQGPDVARAESVLRGLDFVPPEDRDRSWFAEHHFHFRYILPGKRADVELHWRLELFEASSGSELDGLWRRAQTVTLAGIETRVLSPEDLLLHLCAHVSRHIFDYFPLRCLCDVAETIAYFEHLDWSEVRARAERWQIAAQVFLPLLLAHDLMGAPVPEEVLRGLQPSGLDPRLAGWAQQRVLADAVQRVDPAARAFSDTFGQVWASRSLRDKTAALVHAFFPPARSMAQIYDLSDGSWRIYLYYPVRIKDLVVRHGARGWRLLRGQEDEKDWMGREGRRVALTEFVSGKPPAKP